MPANNQMYTNCKFCDKTKMCAWHTKTANIADRASAAVPGSGEKTATKPVYHSIAVYPAEFVADFKDLSSGCYRDDVKVSVRGLVTVKNDKAHNFKMYKIVDEKDKTNEIRIICSESEYVPIDNMTFQEMHEDVEEGDVVKVSGYPSRSYKGNMCIYCSSILVKKYGDDNEYDLEDEFIDNSMIENKEVDDGETDDETYTEDESETEDDDDLFDENVVGEEDEEDEVEETEYEEDDDDDEEEFPEFDAEDDHYIIDSVPLKIYKDHVVYNSVLLEIRSCRVDMPGRLAFVTRKVGDESNNRIKFSVSRLCKNYLGITVEANDIDKDVNRTYDVIEEGKFSDLVKILM